MYAPSPTTCMSEGGWGGGSWRTFLSDPRTIGLLVAVAALAATTIVAVVLALR
jgi:hypothetical protein